MFAQTASRHWSYRNFQNWLNVTMERPCAHTEQGLCLRGSHRYIVAHQEGHQEAVIEMNTLAQDLAVDAEIPRRARLPILHVPMDDRVAMDAQRVGRFSYGDLHGMVRIFRQAGYSIKQLESQTISGLATPVLWCRPHPAGAAPV